jgi:hypothetical protein
MHPTHQRIGLPWPFAAVSAAFLIYACACLSAGQRQEQDFVPERSSIAAAVSNVAYGAPVGSLYTGVLERFLDFKTPLNTTLQHAERHEMLPGALQATITDGNGIGYVVVASLGMRVFGLRTTSLILGMLALMALSAAVFIWRFHDRRMVVVVLYFTTLTVMLLTPLVWSPPYATNLTIGGIRYFSLVAILPAFYLVFECADTQAADLAPWKLFALVAIQTIVLIWASLVRNSAAPVIAAIGMTFVFVAWTHRREREALRRLVTKVAAMIVAAGAFVSLLGAVAPDYLRNGRFTEVVWHRIFLGFHVNPNWPFGLEKKYDCKSQIPNLVWQGADDQMGHCVWWDYVKRHNIPENHLDTMTYGGEYDAALRDATIDIIINYPLEALKTIFYYKPKYVAWSIATSLNFRLPENQPLLAWSSVAALANLFLFALLLPFIGGPDRLATVAGATVLLAAFSIVPYLAVWAMPHTSADLLFYCIFGVGLALTAGIGLVASYPGLHE